MGKELRIHSDEAYDVAHRLAEARGESVDAVVEQALRDLAARGAAPAPQDARGDSEEAGSGPLDPAARTPPNDIENRSADEIIESAKRDIAARRREMTVDGEDIFSEAAIARRRARREALIAWTNRDRPAYDPSVEDEMYDENGLPI